MEELLKKLQAYRRQLELEENLPDWEKDNRELCARISEMSENLQRKELALEAMDNPSFLQRVFGKTKTEKEKLSRQIREIQSARMAAQWEQESLEKRIRSGQQELESLSGSRAAYETAKAERMFTPAQESRIMMEEIAAFAPAAMEAAGRVLAALEMAQLRQDLQEVEAAVKRLHGILSVLPEGVAPVGSFLHAPCDFLQDDNGQYQAREQIQQVVNQLRLLLGE